MLCVTLIAVVAVEGGWKCNPNSRSSRRNRRKGLQGNPFYPFPSVKKATMAMRYAHVQSIRRALDTTGHAARAQNQGKLTSRQSRSCPRGRTFRRLGAC